MKVHGKHMRFAVPVLFYRVLHIGCDQDETARTESDAMLVMGCPVGTFSFFDVEPHRIVDDPRAKLPATTPMPFGSGYRFDRECVEKFIQICARDIRGPCERLD